MVIPIRGWVGGIGNPQVVEILGHKGRHGAASLYQHMPGICEGYTGDMQGIFSHSGVFKREGVCMWVDKNQEAGLFTQDICLA